MTTSKPASIFGVAAAFEGPKELLAAVKRVHLAGYRKFDVHTPFPVHGMDEAMGLKRSKLGWIVFLCGAFGLVFAMAMQWYANAFDYPLIKQGKPYFAWQAFIPVTFELMVLFAAFGAVFGMIALNGLPCWYHPTLKSDGLAKLADDGFYLVIESRDMQFEAGKTVEFLAAIGSKSVCVLEE